MKDQINKKKNRFSNKSKLWEKKTIKEKEEKKKLEYMTNDLNTNEGLKKQQMKKLVVMNHMAEWVERAVLTKMRSCVRVSFRERHFQLAIHALLPKISR